MSDEIEQYCSSFGNVESEFPQPFHEGDFVLAKFAKDGLWYRAEVIGVDSDGTAKVTFLDYGNEEVVLPKNLMMCPENLLELPVQAIPCCLAEVPKSDTWPPSYKELIDSLVSDKELKATVVTPADQGMTSTVTLTIAEEGVDISQSVLAKLEEECEMSSSDIIAEEPEQEGEIAADGAMTRDEEAEALEPPTHPVLPNQDLLQPGTLHDVYVIMCASPQSFVCQLASASEALDTIAAKLAELYASDAGEGDDGNEQCILKVPPNEGELVVALFSDDSQWYRARVVEVCEDRKSCNVLFVDYGNSEIVAVENLRAPHPSLTSHPPMAFECYLTGVEIPSNVVQSELGASDDLLTEAAKEMTEIVGDDICTAEIVTVDESKRLGVTLTNTTTGKDVASLLIQAKLASPVAPQTLAISEEREERLVPAPDNVSELELPKDEGLSAQDEVVSLPVIEGLDPGTTHKVYIVSCASPLSFVCQLTDTTELLDSISAQLEELYTTVGVGYYTLETTPKVGDFVIAQFSVDQQWYRARVKECSEDGKSLEVVYIDYGNMDTVSMENVRKPDPSLAIHPPLAFECFLSNIECCSDNVDDLEQNAAQKLTEIVGDDGGTIEIITVEDSGLFGVSLTTLTTEEDVASLLVEAKLATSSLIGAPPGTENLTILGDTKNLLLTSSGESISMGKVAQLKVPALEKEVLSGGVSEVKATEPSSPTVESTSQEEVVLEEMCAGENHEQPLTEADLQFGLPEPLVRLPNPQELQPATTHEVYIVSCDSPSSFICQLTENSDALDSITTQLAKIYSTEGEATSHALRSPPKVGDFVVALFSQDQEWYRAVVTNLSDDADSCQVLFVDFGNSDTVPVENLCSPEPSLAIHPPLAFECRLTGVAAPSEEAKSAAASEFMKLVDDRSCFIEVLTLESDGCLGVVVTTSDGVNVAMSLIAARLASPLIPTPSTISSRESTTLEENEGGEDAMRAVLCDQDTTTNSAQSTDVQVSDSVPTTTSVEDIEEPLPLPPSDVPSDAPLEIATSLTKLTLEVGRRYPAEVISFTSLEEFVCRITTKEKELRDLVDDIGHQGYFVGEEDPLTVTVPKKGLPVVAHSSKDNCWCRAEITSVEHECNSVCVTYVDNGSSETLSLDRVRHLVKRFADALPTLCVTCSLPILKENDLHPVRFDGDPWELTWPSSCVEQFTQLIDVKTEESSGLSLEVMETTEDWYVVKVIKHLASGEEIDVRSALVEKLREAEMMQLSNDVIPGANDGIEVPDTEALGTTVEATTTNTEPTECVYSVAAGDETVTLLTSTPTPQPATGDNEEELDSTEGEAQTKDGGNESVEGESKPEDDENLVIDEKAVKEDDFGQSGDSDEANAKLPPQSGEEAEWTDASPGITEQSTSDTDTDVPLTVSEMVSAEASQGEAVVEGSNSKTALESMNGNEAEEDVKPCLLQEFSTAGIVHECTCSVCVYNLGERWSLPA